MDKFWEWMFKKEYASNQYIVRHHISSQHYGRFIPGTEGETFTKHMLIGYMMEYLRAKRPGVVIKMQGRLKIVDIYYKLEYAIENLKE